MTTLLGSGHLKKMQVSHTNPIQYHLPLDEQRLPMNELIGKQLQIRYGGDIHCQHCGRKSKKSFSQGYCYPCFKKLAQCDTCIMSPEKCHYHEGTCREPEWGEKNCFVDHFVYLANSSGIKVGITRGTQVPVRWIDQGAVQALPIMRVQTRQQSGLVEDVLRAHVKDRTDWRAMLKGNAEPQDLAQARDELFALCHAELAVLEDKFGVQALQRLTDVPSLDFCYPVTEFPTKVKSFNLDKIPVAEGVLMGIKGQYLIFDTGVINMRKYTSYHVDISIL